MSTKAIREVIEAYRKTDIPIPERHPKVLAALSQVEAIEKAARTAAEQGLFEQETEDEATRSAIDAAEDVFHAIAVETMS